MCEPVRFMQSALKSNQREFSPHALVVHPAGRGV
jgi:hypothetical protein